MHRPKLDIHLTSPRGFCAGVERAIDIVKQALEQNGPPIYVRHEIVHNKHVVDELRGMGAIFVDELSEVPDDGIVIFSAHGVPQSVPGEARRRKMIYVDATCPLVSKVHREVERHVRNGLQILLIGHRGHPEVIGTMGQAPEGAVRLVESVEDVDRIEICDETALAYATQTTLSLSDTAAIVTALKARFPDIQGPRNEDICYATTNRQEAVASVAPNADLFLVVGSQNSSNSKRLVEVAMQNGCPRALLIADQHDIPWEIMLDVRSIGLSAGASAPEVLVDGVIAAFRERFDVQVRRDVTAVEDVHFRTPPIPTRKLADDAHRNWDKTGS